MRRNLPPRDHFLGKTFPFLPNHEVTDHIGSGANGHVYRIHADNISGDLALKIVPTENLPVDDEGRERYLNEAKKANVLHNQCVVRYQDVRHWDDQQLGRTFVVFICEYVDGQSLERYLKTHSRDIEIGFIEDFLRKMFGLLHELKERGMSHGDLHAGNVLVSRSRFDLTEEIQFKVTDFGVADVTTTDHNSDFLFLADILAKLLRCIDYQQHDARDRFVFDILRNEFLGRHLIETNPLADSLAGNPREMLRKLNGIDRLFGEAKRKHTVTEMVTPFDYPNCEQMGNAHLLLKSLYSDRLLGLSEIQAQCNLVLTGPRGCGKTTVFRALSLEYAMSVDVDDPEEIRFIGVYYRCDDLYFSFPRYELPVRGAALDIPMHFVVVSLMIETLRQVRQWGIRHFQSELEQHEASVVGVLRETLGLRPANQAVSRGLRSVVSELARQRARAARKQRFCHVPTEPIEGYLGPDALLRCCRELRSGFPFLNERPFFFFIDDYSIPKISSALQQNLNRLFMHRQADAFFKLSTESPVSFERQDVDGKQYVEQREYELLNLGLRYLGDDGRQVREFLEDLFYRRFSRVADFPCESIVELLGDSPRNENEVARQFRKGKKRGAYHGIQTVTAMCSGDIHYMIRLVGRMVEDVGGADWMRSRTALPRIPRRSQSGTIRSAAGEFMDSVRTLPGRGDELAMVVSAVGNVARSYMHYRTAGNDKGRPPHQASRIEPYEALELSREAREVLDDLIRFSILLIDPRGKSRRGAIVPRFYLRRYLIPHFSLTFSKRDSLQLENRDIELLLLNPRKFEEAKRLKRKTPRVERIKHEQTKLFGPQGE